MKRLSMETDLLPLQEDDMNKKPTCEVAGCRQEPDRRIQWGIDERQQAVVCPQHSMEIWEEVQPQIKLGPCFWVVQPLTPPSYGK